MRETGREGRLTVGGDRRGRDRNRVGTEIGKGREGERRSGHAGGIGTGVRRHSRDRNREGKERGETGQDRSEEGKHSRYRSGGGTCG